jgi:hypothetical protein
MKTTRVVLTTLALATFAATAALATQVIQRTPRELAQESVLIVDGTVTGVRSYWSPDRSRILTETTVAVSSTYKGAGGGIVRVLQPGGVVGNVRMTAHGALSWRRGEEVLLFLEPALNDAFQVAGFSQGKYEIERDGRTGQAFVRQAPPVGGEGASAPVTATAPAKSQRLTVEQFINQALPRE